MGVTWTFESVEHFLLIVAGIGTLLGIAKIIRGWQEARDEAVIARAKQADTLKRIEDSINEHYASAKEVAERNARDHEGIHRRIDGILTLLGCNEQARKAAERHRAARFQDEEVVGDER